MLELKVNKMELVARDLKNLINRNIRLELWNPNVKSMRWEGLRYVDSMWSYEGDTIRISIDSRMPLEQIGEIRNIINNHKVDGINYCVELHRRAEF